MKTENVRTSYVALSESLAHAVEATNRLVLDRAFRPADATPARLADVLTAWADVASKFEAASRAVESLTAEAKGYLGVANFAEGATAVKDAEAKKMKDEMLARQRAEDQRRRGLA